MKGYILELQTNLCFGRTGRADSMDSYNNLAQVQESTGAAHC